MQDSNMLSAGKSAGKRKTLKSTTNDEAKWANRTAKTLQDKCERMITNSGRSLNPDVVGVVDSVIEAVSGLRWLHVAPQNFDRWIDTLIHAINWPPQLDRHEMFAKTTLLFAGKDIGHAHSRDYLRSSRVNKTCAALKTFRNGCVYLVTLCPRGFWVYLELTVKTLHEFEQIHTGRPTSEFPAIFSAIVAKYAGQGRLINYNKEAVTETVLLAWNIHTDTTNPLEKACARECAAAARQAFILELQKQWVLPTED